MYHVDMGQVHVLCKVLEVQVQALPKVLEVQVQALPKGTFFLASGTEIEWMLNLLLNVL